MDNPWRSLAQASYRSIMEKAYKHLDDTKDLGGEDTPETAMMFCACYVSMSVAMGADEETTVELARSMFRDVTNAQKSKDGQGK